MQSAEEASQAVQQIEAKFLVLDRSCLQQWPDLKQCCPSLQLQVLLGPGFNHPASINAEKVLILAGQNPRLDFYWGPDSVALICFTSGILCLCMMHILISAEGLVFLLDVESTNIFHKLTLFQFIV
jgi:hypothetical protein